MKKIIKYNIYKLQKDNKNIQNIQLNINIREYQGIYIIWAINNIYISRKKKTIILIRLYIYIVK